VTDKQSRAMLAWIVALNIIGMAALVGVIVYVARMVWG